ncbi:hypothetical protein H8356DRAFT_1069654 [Neocallimastix lanati (nom. inval.)]|nr:hypothetical protein H8356DRAFT_1069654 [Neocallimastix sp. JGI-2020a]
MTKSENSTIIKNIIQKLQQIRKDSKDYKYIKLGLTREEDNKAFSLFLKHIRPSHHLILCYTVSVLKIHIFKIMKIKIMMEHFNKLNKSLPKETPDYYYFSILENNIFQKLINKRKEYVHNLYLHL